MQFSNWNFYFLELHNKDSSSQTKLRVICENMYWKCKIITKIVNKFGLSVNDIIFSTAQIWRGYVNRQKFLYKMSQDWWWCLLHKIANNAIEMS